MCDSSPRPGPDVTLSSKLVPITCVAVVSCSSSSQSMFYLPELQPPEPRVTVPEPLFCISLRYLDFFADFISFFPPSSPKKYTPSDPAFAYAQLTHDELIQLVLKQKETISKKEFQVRELEDYIDNLLVRVMEETPNILRVPAQVGKKAGKM